MSLGSTIAEDRTAFLWLLSFMEKQFQTQFHRARLVIYNKMTTRTNAGFPGCHLLQHTDSRWMDYTLRKWMEEMQEMNAALLVLGESCKFTPAGELAC